jgi:hypothetical protein
VLSLLHLSSREDETVHFICLFVAVPCYVPHQPNTAMEMFVGPGSYDLSYLLEANG